MLSLTCCPGFCCPGASPVVQGSGLVCKRLLCLQCRPTAFKSLSLVYDIHHIRRGWAESSDASDGVLGSTLTKTKTATKMTEGRAKNLLDFWVRFWVRQRRKRRPLVAKQQLFGKDLLPPRPPGENTRGEGKVEHEDQDEDEDEDQGIRGDDEKPAAVGMQAQLPLRAPARLQHYNISLVTTTSS